MEKCKNLEAAIRWDFSFLVYLKDFNDHCNKVSQILISALVCWRLFQLFLVNPWKKWVETSHVFL